jgi:predicted transcriptional regulator
VPHETSRSTFLSLRLSHKLANDLRIAANRESNSASAVARRLISSGLSREREQQSETRELKRRSGR